MKWPYEPYTLRRVRPPVWFWNVFYYLQFEYGDVAVAGEKKEAEELCNLMNAAYNLGYMQAEGDIRGRRQDVLTHLKKIDKLEKHS